MKEGLPCSLVCFSGFANFIRFQTYGFLGIVFYFILYEVMVLLLLK